MFQNWRKEFDKFWPECLLKVSKIFTLMASLRANYILFELKKYRGVIFHETEERYKIWRGIDSSFQNWHKEFDKIWPEHSKVSKNFILMGSYWAKYIFSELKKNRGIIFHETEEDTKFGEGSTCRFKIGIRNLTKFDLSKFSPEHLKVSKLGFWWDPFVRSRKGIT